MSDQNQPTPTIEDYLSLIFSMDFDEEKITGAKLADYLGVSAPTVTATLQRMERDGWISSGDKKAIALTEKGKSAALVVVHRHNLVECLLYEVLGMPLASLHEEAHRIEHAISPDTEAYLHKKFMQTQYSPFGMPLLGDKPIAASWIPLLQAAPQDKLVIRRIIHYHCTREALQFLENHRLAPGAIIRVVQRQEFNQTIDIQLETSGEQITLGYPIARIIQVERLS